MVQTFCNDETLFETRQALDDENKDDKPLLADGIFGLSFSDRLTWEL